MANERNARAIADAIGAWLETEIYLDLGSHDRPGDGGQLDRFAAFLAARGVLVPSVLTDEQLKSLEEWEPALSLRESLTDIAKGDDR